MLQHTGAKTADPVALAGLKGALEPEHPHYGYGMRGKATRGRERSDGLVDCTNNYTGGNCSSQNPTSFIELKRTQACVAALRPPEIAPSGIAADERRRASPQIDLHLFLRLVLMNWFFLQDIETT